MQHLSCSCTIDFWRDNAGSSRSLFALARPTFAIEPRRQHAIGHGRAIPGQATRGRPGPPLGTPGLAIPGPTTPGPATHRLEIRGPRRQAVIPAKSRHVDLRKQDVQRTDLLNDPERNDPQGVQRRLHQRIHQLMAQFLLEIELRHQQVVRR